MYTPCIRHAQCVSHAHNEQGVAVGEKILAYRNLWSPRDRRRSRYSLVAEPRQISLSDDLSRPQFPYFEDQFWSFLRILRIILRKTSFLVNPPVHENVVDMLYFSANIWSKKRIQFFPLLFFLLLRSTRSGAQKKEFEREFSERKKNEIFAIRVRRIISSILAGLVSSGRKDRASFPNGSRTIYECVNLSPEGFLRWTGNEPCETAFPNDFQTTTIRRGPSRPTTRYKFVCPVFWPHLPCIIREHSCERSANAATRCR